MQVWFQLSCYVIIFYSGYLWLTPRLFFSGKKLLFFLASGLLILVFTTFLWLLLSQFNPVFTGSHKPFMPPPDPVRDRMMKEFRSLPPPDRIPAPLRNWPLFNFLLTSGMVTGLSLGLRLSEKLSRNEKMRKEAEKDKLHSELSILKHQINPHFLFNTLNSIYSLALVKSDLTAEAVMKLSDMMRYVIQDVEHETVPLERELEYMGHYVEFQKIRLNEKAVVRVSIAGDPTPYQIPPMILVPFIENAFKYGTSSHEKSVITIVITITAGKLAFGVTNQVFAGRENTETFGIGLQNTRQRLNLMYPGKHRLVLTNDGKVFMANLEITMA